MINNIVLVSGVQRSDSVIYMCVCVCVCLNFFLFNLFYFWLCWVFVTVRGRSLAAASGGYSLLWCAGFSLWWLLLLRSTGSRRVGFSSCGTWASVVVACGL